MLTAHKRNVKRINQHKYRKNIQLYAIIKVNIFRKVDNSRGIDCSRRFLSEVAEKCTDLSIDKNGHSTRKCLIVSVT